MADIRAANAAEDLLDLSILQFVAGVAGIILVALTLKATREAVQEAKNATSAANAAVAATVESGRSEVRAYVAIEGGSVLVGGPEETLRINIKLKNFGNSPAKRVHLQASVGVVKMWPPATDTDVDELNYAEQYRGQPPPVAWSNNIGRILQMIGPGKAEDFIFTLSEAVHNRQVVTPSYLQSVGPFIIQAIVQVTYFDVFECMGNDQTHFYHWGVEGVASPGEHVFVIMNQ